MDWKKDCSALLPCFNEAASLARVVRDVREQLPNILVVDDGSSDDSARIARDGGAEVVRHAANRGKGAALRTGFRQLRDRGLHWALTMDADGQHAAADIAGFFARADATGADLVIGNRLSDPRGMPWLRLRVNRWMTRRFSRRTGISVADSQCGFRLVRLAALAGVPLRTDHFEIESELLLAMVRARRRIEFVPVQVIYEKSPSKIHPCRDAWRWLRWWWASR